MTDTLLPGVIIAGGQSRRLAGPGQAGAPFHKGNLLLGDKSLLGRVVESIQPQVNDLLLNSNGGLHPTYNLTVVDDGPWQNHGPLAGLLQAMHYCKAHWPGCEWLLSVTADTPFLPGDLAERLMAAAVSENSDLAIASSNDNQHYLTGVWSLSLAPALENYLREGSRSVRGFISQQKVGRRKTARVIFSSRPDDPFFNINTEEDLALARQRMQEKNED